MANWDHSPQARLLIATLQAHCSTKALDIHSYLSTQHLESEYDELTVRRVPRTSVSSLPVSVSDRNQNIP